MNRDELTIGRRVWYEPSFGVRFLARVAQAPRPLGNSWCVALEFTSAAYGCWRRADTGGEIRMSCPAAAIDCVYPDHTFEEAPDVSGPAATCDTCGREECPGALPFPGDCTAVAR